MVDLITKFEAYKDKKIALYGLGTETEKVISEMDGAFEIVGLLDGFKDSGEIYGKTVIPLERAVSERVELIVVVARPGSCKAIKKRIGDICIENKIALMDVRGKDLLVSNPVFYRFFDNARGTKAELIQMVKEADAVSFDLFDTLVTRQLYSYTDIFELMELELRKQGVKADGFAKQRLASEKELSKNEAPSLVKIYENVIAAMDFPAQGENVLTADSLAEMEWETEQKVILPRRDVVEVFKEIVASGKSVYIISDTYYSREQIEQLLASHGILGHAGVFASCEYGTGKTQRLFEMYCDMVNVGSYLHIGDDSVADIESAAKCGIKTFRLCSGIELFDELGTLGMENYIKSLADRIKAGIWIAEMFNSPFRFENEEGTLEITDARNVGYLLCAPMISDFVIWMDERIRARKMKNIWFCARDGYLINQMYEELGREEKAEYFLTSRTAAIRAGMQTDADIVYVDGMKFFGTVEESLRVRFGIEATEVLDAAKEAGGMMRYKAAIMEKSSKQRENYKTYIHSLSLLEGEIAFFDFVAKGTTQMYMQRVVDNPLRGYYFLQLEPEFMSDKGLDIEPFYTDAERDCSAIFDHYYILETILTAPHPSISEFDENGNPVYAKETRCERDIQCFARAQKGILDYFRTYISLVPERERVVNKQLDEMLLALVAKIKITDPDFMALSVEDPFFNRMTDIKDVIE